MRSSRFRPVLAWLGAGAVLVAGVWSASAEAQQQAQGFDLERLYTSAPGGGWFVMDTLDMRGGLGGAVNMVTSYARNPLRITDGSQHLAVVSDEAFLELGAAATYDRFRLYFSFDSPLTVQGNGGTLGGYAFTAPSVDLASSPDAVSHARAGFDARILGDPTSAFRLGFGAQLWFPGGAPGALRSTYLSDGPPSDSLGAYNAMVRVLFAGDVNWFTYAGHLGVHLRALDDSPTPGSPQGSELLFGVAGGVKAPVLGGGSTALVVGPEVYGASAFRSFLSTTGTALEGLLSARLEGTAEGPQLRLKLGTGAGLNQHFGAPEWRLVLGVELFDRTIAGSSHAGSR
jgi:hypothetical protein